MANSTTLQMKVRLEKQRNILHHPGGTLKVFCPCGHKEKLAFPSCYSSIPQWRCHNCGLVIQSDMFGEAISDCNVDRVAILQRRARMQ